MESLNENLQMEILEMLSFSDWIKIMKTSSNMVRCFTVNEFANRADERMNHFMSNIGLISVTKKKIDFILKNHGKAYKKIREQMLEEVATMMSNLDIITNYLCRTRNKIFPKETLEPIVFQVNKYSIILLESMLMKDIAMDHIKSGNIFYKGVVM